MALQVQEQHDISAVSIPQSTGLDTPLYVSHCHTSVFCVCYTCVCLCIIFVYVYITSDVQYKIFHILPNMIIAHKFIAF